MFFQVLATLAIAWFSLMVGANQSSMTNYSFLTSHEGKMATVACTTLTYAAFALLGHLGGDRYVALVSTVPNTQLHMCLTCSFPRHPSLP